jgi:hypothetical protein
MVLRPSYFSRTLPIGEVVIDHRLQLWDGRYMAAPATALILAGVLVIAKGQRHAAGHPKLVGAAAGLGLAAMLILNFPVDLHRDSEAAWRAQVLAEQAACARQSGSGLVTIKYGIFTHPPEWRLVLTCRQAFGP